MGAAPVLIMLAVVGVDYGWQPDGTTSSRGDNIEYIVQVSPDQLQQLKSFGEITSAIDPSVQGRVSRIIVKIGTGALPRNAGRAAVSQASTRAGTRSTPNDNETMPIPEMPHRPVLAAVPKEATGAAVMKPDPQGGFALPEAANNVPSALDQVRNRAGAAAAQLDSQTRAFDADSGVAQSAIDAARNAAGALKNGINSLTNPSGPPATPLNNNPIYGPATNPNSPLLANDPLANRDDSWNDLTNRNATNLGPSTDPIDPRQRAWPTTTANGADPRSLNNSTNPAYNNSTNPAYNNNTNPAYGNPATRDPSDPKWSGYGTTPTFGAYPGSNRNTAADAYGPTSTAQTDPRQLQLSEPNADGLRQDARGNLYNRYGQPLDAKDHSLANQTTPYPNTNSNNTVPNNGQYANGTTRDQYGNRIDNQGHLIDGFGNRIDSQGNLLDPRLAMNNQNRSQATYPATAADRFGNSPYDSSLYSNNPFRQSSYPTSSTLAANQATNGYLRNPNDPRTSGLGSSAISPSDGLTVAGIAERERLAALAAARSRTVAAQPFFNFVLLISLVGNAYLIFETSNLRRKFRNMITSVRGTKISAQTVAVAAH